MENDNKKKVGRPKKPYKVRGARFTMECPLDLHEELKKFCKSRRIGKSDFIIECVRIVMDNEDMCNKMLVEQFLTKSRKTIYTSQYLKDV